MICVCCGDVEISTIENEDMDGMAICDTCVVLFYTEYEEEPMPTKKAGGKK